MCDAWRRHQMETLSASLAICAGNSPITDGAIAHYGVTVIGKVSPTVLSMVEYGFPAQRVWVSVRDQKPELVYDFVTYLGVILSFFIDDYHHIENQIYPEQMTMFQLAFMTKAFIVQPTINAFLHFHACIFVNILHIVVNWPHCTDKRPCIGLIKAKFSFLSHFR